MTQQHEGELTLGDCHFCQSSALKIWGPDSRTGMSHVTCDNCGARGPLRGSAKMAAAEWAKAVSRHNKPKAPEGYALVPIDPWRDIATAPEFEAVLVYGGADVRYPVSASKTDNPDEGWQLDHLGYCGEKISVPTHWQPLPAAPSITEPGEAI